MKKIYTFILAVILIGIFSINANAQLTGIKTIGVDYTTISAAITDLNTQGVGAGGVTFNVPAGYTETISTALSITATGTTANQIIFQKSGAGANPLITAYTGGTGTPGTAVQDGIWNLVGSDYITIDGIDLRDNPSNTTNPSTMEYGFGMFKASVTNGCQYNTIKNCVVTLNRINFASGTSPAVDGSRAINIMNSLVTTQTTVLVPTSAAGTNSYNKFYSNTVQNCNIGFALIGYAGASPFTLCDYGNDIGGSSLATGNNILNYGGGTSATNPAAGVRTLAQYDLNVSYNTVNNNNGSGVNHVSTLRGIYLNTAVSASSTINNNTLSISSGATTSQVSVIENVSGGTAAGNTVNINNNIINNCSWTTSTSGIFYGIYNTASPANLNINSNSFATITRPGTGAANIIYNSGVAGTSLSISNNTFNNLSIASTGSVYLIYNNTATNNMTINNNSISGTFAKTGAGGTVYGYYDFGSPTGGTATLSGNNFSNITLTGATTFYGIDHRTSTTQVILLTNNTISNITGGTSPLYGIYQGYGAAGSSVNGNTVSAITGSASGAGIIYGIVVGTSAPTSLTVYNNNVNGISTGGTGAIYGIQNVLGTSNSFYKNRVYNLSSSNASGTIYGFNFTGGTLANVFNNFVSDLRATSATGANAIAGIYIGGGTTVNLYFNTVYLNATGGATFGSSGIYKSSTTASDFRNNIIVNNSTPGSTSGNTVALRWSGVYNATYYTSTSNNNCFYAGTPGTNRLIYFDGGNSDQTISAYKTRVASRDAASFTENPPFVNVSSTPYDLHLQTTIPTQCESGGTVVATPIAITDDYDANIRNASTPDVGADEGTFTALDLTAPTINYTALANTGSTSNRTLIASISDYSGVPTSGIGLPVLYWKIGAGSYSAATGTYVSGNNYQFSFGTGVVFGDVVSYYIVAQDLASTPNVGANPSGGAAGFTSNPPACSTPPTTPNTYSITDVALNGDYTVGTTMFNKISGKNISFEKIVKKVMKEVFVEEQNSDSKQNNFKANDDKLAKTENSTSSTPKGRMELREVEEISWVPMENGKVYEGNLYIKKSENPNFNYPSNVNGIYATITAAVADLNLRGVSGPTRFLLNDVSYTSGETYPITVNVTNENIPTVTNTVTIKPNLGVTSSIQAPAASLGTQVFQIRSSFVSIDGSNAVSGTSRDLTIENQYATSPQVIGIRSSGTIPITNVTVKNCIIINGANSSSAVVVSDLAGTAGYFNNITLQNNSVQKAYIGIYYLGTVAVGNGSGSLITGNDLNTSGANSIRLVGIYAQGVDGVTVSNNNIGNIADANAENPKGIWFATGTNSGTISGNNISSINLTNTGAYASNGITVSSGASVTGINVTNNTVTGLSNSGTTLAFTGISFSTPNTNVTNNTLSNMTQNAAATFWGIIGNGATNSTISGNTITGLTTALSGSVVALNIQGASTGITISKNKIYNIKNTNATTGYSVYGILLQSSSTTANSTVSNNILYDIASYGSASFTGSNGYGIYVTTGGGYNIYYNSINLATNQTLTTGLPACLVVSSSITTANTLDIRNNIFSIPATVGTDRYAVICNANTSVFSNLNYNDYFTSGTNLGYYNAANVLDLTAWKTALGKDANSVSGDPKFTEATNLHIITTQISPVNDAGSPIAGITTDYDGDTRSGSTPDIGMDEYTYTAPSVLDPTSLAASVISSTQIDLSWLNNGNNDNVMLVWNSSNTFGVPTDNQVYSVNDDIPGGGKVLYVGMDQAFNHTSLTPGTLYYYKAFSADPSYTYSPGVMISATTFNSPTLTTTAATLVSYSTATTGGNVSSDGGTTITERGVCYSTSLNPTTADSKITASGTIGAFTSNLTGLTGGTLYHFRAYAINSVGTSYGSDLTFTTKTPASLPWSENFDGVTIPAFPTDWSKENGDWVTTNNANSTYDADAHSGTQFLRDSWTATNEYIWTPGFQLTGGQSYDFSFWWAGDTYAGWTGDIFYNTTQSSVGATQLGSSFVTSGTTTTKTYAQVTRTFTPGSTGVYSFAIRVNEPSGSPWYLSFDDFALNVLSIANPNAFAATVNNSTQIDLTFTPNGLSSNVVIVWNNTGTFTPPSGVPPAPGGSLAGGTVLYNGTSSPQSHTGLTPGTLYYYKAFSYDGSSSYSTGLTANASTLYPIPYSQDFNAGLTIPAGWSQTSTLSNRWTFAATTNAGGTFNEATATYVSGTGTSRLVSPPLSTSGMTGLKLSFKQFFDDYAAGITYKVQSSLDGVTWTDEAWTNASGLGNIGPQTVTTTIMNNLGSKTYVAFVLDGNHYNFDYWYIDDISITQIPANDVGTFSVDVNANQNPGIVTPKATIKNFGSATNTFPVTMTITGGYTSTKTVTSLAPGATTQVTFDDWTAALGQYTVNVATQLTGDADPSNDSQTKLVGVYTGSWSIGAVVPSAGATYLGSGVGYTDFSVTPRVGYLFSIAGNTNSALGTECYKYNVNTNTWTAIASLPAGRRVLATANVGNFIYAIGGSDMSSVAQSAVYKYDIALDSWTTVASLPVATTWGKAVGYNNRIYFAGGSDGTNYLATVYVYDVVANTWTPATSMPGGRIGGAFSITGNTLVYVGGADATNLYSTVFRGTINPSNPLDISWTATAKPYPGNGKEYINISGKLDESSVPVKKDETGKVVKKGETKIDDSGNNVISSDNKNTKGKTETPNKTKSLNPAGALYKFDAAPWGTDGIIVAGGNADGGWSPATPNPCYVYKPGTDSWEKQGDVESPILGASIGSVNVGDGANHNWKLVVASGLSASGTSTVTQIWTDQIVPSSRSFVITSLLEGFKGAGNTPDNVVVELKDPSTFATVESKTIVQNSTGLGSAQFTTALNATQYWIVLKYSNGIETWSASTQAFSGSYLSYDFTTSSNKAFGDNMILVSGKWCVFSGDVNQDGVVDLLDLIDVDNDNANFVTGNVVTDLNGDLAVDLLDLILCDNNNTNFIAAIKPPGAPAIKITRTPEQTNAIEKFKKKIEQLRKEKKEMIEKTNKQQFEQSKKEKNDTGVKSEKKTNSSSK